LIAAFRDKLQLRDKRLTEKLIQTEKYVYLNNLISHQNRRFDVHVRKITIVTSHQMSLVKKGLIQ